MFEPKATASHSDSTIRDQTSWLCLPVDVRFSPKAT
jgi:hypothetical protein